MLTSILESRDLTIEQVVIEAIRYFARCRQPDGSIAEDPSITVFREWDSVNAVKAIGLWQNKIRLDGRAVAEPVLEFLAGREKATGMLSWGAIEIDPSEYCTETSSEYICALGLFGRDASARSKADFLRGQQLPDGPWAEVHGHIPRAFQLEPSVTGFALAALESVESEPRYLDEALDFLVRRQQDAGHFGINWYYYCTHYYLMRPAVAALACFGNYAAVGRARDFVLAQQRPDGSWFSEIEEFGETAAAELQTALALATLAHTGASADEPPLRRAIEWLLARRRPDGSWFGGRYPYPRTDSYRPFRATQDVFTTAQVLTAFELLETS
ncbi:prenyltransferase/squalene oxidase repeat-containing protein [Nocardia wallacei]|uniref:prenyltransferase/squalene oxidase repeat-containing protein n=1 Tax=Nocardia wallacei TaxID=480035 RepID=UPI0024553217|nr:terpene cyclase/mutase family protein [Nocardia wallacei]